MGQIGDSLEQIDEEQKYEEMCKTGNCYECGNALNDDMYCMNCNKQWEM